MLLSISLGVTQELKRLLNLRKGYPKSLLSKANEAIKCHTNSPTECNIPVLNKLRRQFQRKDDILSDLDSQIAALIESEEELVDDIVEAEDIKTSLSTTIDQITQLLETRPTPTELQPVFQPITVSNSEIHQPTSQDVPQQIESDLTAKVSHSDHPPPINHSRPNTVPSQGVTRLPKLTTSCFQGIHYSGSPFGIVLRQQYIVILLSLKFKNSII